MNDTIPDADEITVGISRELQLVVMRTDVEDFAMPSVVAAELGRQLLRAAEKLEKETCQTSR